MRIMPCREKRKMWIVTSADEMPSRSLYPSQKWQTCGESRRSTVPDSKT
jgi:hypothetical protein